MSRGGRNLLILGIAAILITSITCGISLYIYHASGDIYLDRSRPGFLPDQTESNSSVDSSFSLSESGGITAETLELYLQNLELELEKLNSISDPFSNAPLSDESLGISPE